MSSLRVKGFGPQVEAVATDVIGAAIEVHRELGAGHLECVYEDAMAIELALRKIPFERQKSLPVFFKGHKLHEGRVDFVVAKLLALELKAVAALGEIHTAITVSYLKALRQPLGILINFNVAVLRDGLRRVVFTK